MKNYNKNHELTDDGIITSEGKLYPNDHRIVKIARIIKELAIEKNYDELAKYDPEIIHETVGFELTRDESTHMYDAILFYGRTQNIVGTVLSKVRYAMDVRDGEAINPLERWKSIPEQIECLIKEDAEARGIDVSEQSVITEYTTLYGDGMNPEISEQVTYLKEYYQHHYERYKALGVVE